MPRRKRTVVRPDCRRREHRKGWHPSDSWDKALQEEHLMLQDLLRLSDILMPEAKMKPRGKPVADARCAASQAVAPRRVYGFQSPFGRPPAKVPAPSGGQAGNANALKHGRTSAAAKADKAQRKRAVRDVRAIRRRLDQVAHQWLKEGEGEEGV